MHVRSTYKPHPHLHLVIPTPVQLHVHIHRVKSEPPQTTHSLTPPPPSPHLTPKPIVLTPPHPHNQHTEFCLPGKSRPLWGGCSSEGTGCRWLSVPPVCKQKHWHCCGGALSSPAKQANCICSAANVMLTLVTVYQLHCWCYWLKREQRLMWRIGETHSNTTRKWCRHIPSLSFPHSSKLCHDWLCH